MEVAAFYVTSDGPYWGMNDFDTTRSPRVLASADTAESIPIPTEIPLGGGLVRIQANKDIWYDLNDTAVEPTVDDTGTSIYLPAGQERLINLQRKSKSLISVVSSVAGCKVCTVFWK